MAKKKTSSGKTATDALEEDLAIALFAAHTANNKKAEDIICFDLRGKSDVVDYAVVATVHSQPQMRATVNAVTVPLKGFGIKRLGLEGESDSQWVLMDYGNCVVHLFSPEFRSFYDLDGLWSGAKRLDWENTSIPSIPDFPEPEGFADVD